jgi:hypothetical protein
MAIDRQPAARADSSAAGRSTLTLGRLKGRFVVRVSSVAAGCLAALALFGAGGCVGNRAASGLGRRYYGTWENVDPRYFNWWVIDARGALNYGIALDGGKCGARRATVAAANSIVVGFGNSGNVTLRLAEGDLLLFQMDRSFALHKRVDASSICRRPDGSYFEGAPSAP